jgi:hypothetical protein
MMTKNEIAQKIDFADRLTREISSDCLLEFIEGETYNNRGKAESWCAASLDSQFFIEIERQYRYVFQCYDKVPCHKVDYNNDEEVEILNAHENEGEVLVPANTKFRIVSVATDEDFEEMGYYEIELELVEEEN